MTEQAEQKTTVLVVDDDRLLRRQLHWALVERHRVLEAETRGEAVAYLQHEQVDVVICDLVGERVTRESLSTLRSDIAELRDRLGESELGARDYPHREKYLLLALGFLRRFLDLHEQLIEDVERELDG